MIAVASAALRYLLILPLLGSYGSLPHDRTLLGQECDVRILSSPQCGGNWPIDKAAIAASQDAVAARESRQNRPKSGIAIARASLSARSLAGEGA